MTLSPNYMCSWGLSTEPYVSECLLRIRTWMASPHPSLVWPHPMANPTPARGFLTVIAIFPGVQAETMKSPMTLLSTTSSLSTPVTSTFELSPEPDSSHHLPCYLISVSPPLLTWVIK